MKLPGPRKTLLSGIAITALSVAAITAVPAAAKAPEALVSAQANGPQSDFPVVVGAPYQIGGVTFVPSDSMNFDSVGYALVGQAGGAAISAAHHTLPLPSYAEVTDLKSGRTILVRIERRGPADSNHAIELSPGAAAQLGIAAGSNAGVRVRRVNPPEQDRALLRSGNPALERMATPKPLLDVLQRKLDPALAQRTLDAEDRDPAPAVRPTNQPPVKPAAKPSAAIAAPAKVTAATKPPATPKPAVAKPASTRPAAPPALADPTVKIGPAGAPPMGYVPSVPASVPDAQPSAHVSKGKAEKPGKPAKATEGKPVAIKPAVVEKPVDEKPAHAAPSAGGSLVVQAGAFSDKKRAEAVAGKIGGTVSAAGKVWRVRVGPFAGHAPAEAALAKVKSAGYSDARIQHGE